MTELISLHDNTAVDGLCISTPDLEMKVSCSETRAKMQWHRGGL